MRARAHMCAPRSVVAGYYCPAGSPSSTSYACRAGNFGTAVDAHVYTDDTCSGACIAPPGYYCPTASTSISGVGAASSRRARRHVDMPNIVRVRCFVRVMGFMVLYGVVRDVCV